MSISEHKVFDSKQQGYVKRGNQTIRQNCIDFIDYLKALSYTDQVPLEEAKFRFQELLGCKDRTTLKAYFGTMPDKSERVIDRTARYTTGTISMKKIILRQDIAKRAGYIEFMNLVQYEKRGSTWFLLLNESSVVSEFQRRMGTSVKERIVQARVSIDKFSLSSLYNSHSHIVTSTQGRSFANEQTHEDIVTKEKRESVLGGEREKTLQGLDTNLYPKPEKLLDDLEKQILKAAKRGDSH